MKIFKAILLISIYVNIVPAKEWNIKYGDDIKSIRDVCLAQHSISEQNFKNIKLYTFDNVLEVRQYLLCTAEELGIIDADNKLIKNNVVEQFRMDIVNRGTVEEIVDKCEIESKGLTPADVMIYKFFMCLLSDQNEIGQKIRTAAKKSEPLALNQPESSQEESIGTANESEITDLSDSPNQPEPNLSQLGNNEQNSGQQNAYLEDIQAA